VRSDCELNYTELALAITVFNVVSAIFHPYRDAGRSRRVIRYPDARSCKRDKTRPLGWINYNLLLDPILELTGQSETQQEFSPAHVETRHHARRSRRRRGRHSGCCRHDLDRCERCARAIRRDDNMTAVHPGAGAGSHQGGVSGAWDR
jgi:hypothetical protein